MSASICHKRYKQSQPNKSMSITSILKDLDYNTQILLKELHACGVKLHRVPNSLVVRATYKQKTELLFDITSSAGSFTSSWIASDKYYSKQFLIQKGFPVPEGKVFLKSELEPAVVYAKKLGYPVVAKPVADSHGEYVYALLESESELRQAIRSLVHEHQGPPHFILEKHVPGNEYRLFVTRNDFFATVLRIPANVTGDGVHSIMQLIQIENFRRLNPRTTCLSDIKIDDMVFNHLEKQQLSIESIPKKKQCVQLRATSNVSKGGNCYAVTDTVHPTFIALAKEILQSVSGLPFVGIDLLCSDISKPATKQKYWICELNASPGLSLHTVPERGESQNTPSAIAKSIFPSLP